MKYYQVPENAEWQDGGNEHRSLPMLGEAQGCTNGCCAGISVYQSKTYTPAGVHQDQEGFLVLSGSGWAKIGEDEFRLTPRMAFVAPRNTPHQMKSDSDEPLELFWFHAQA